MDRNLEAVVPCPNNLGNVALTYYATNDEGQRYYPNRENPSDGSMAAWYAYPSAKIEKLTKWVSYHGYLSSRDGWTDRQIESAVRDKHCFLGLCKELATLVGARELCKLQKETAIDGYRDSSHQWDELAEFWEKQRAKCAQLITEIQSKRPAIEAADAVAERFRIQNARSVPFSKLAVKNNSRGARNPKPYGDRLCEFPKCIKIATCRDHLHDGMAINEGNFRGYVCGGHNIRIGRLDKNGPQSPEEEEYLRRRPWKTGTYCQPAETKR